MISSSQKKNITRGFTQYLKKKKRIFVDDFPMKKKKLFSMGSPIAMFFMTPEGIQMPGDCDCWQKPPPGDTFWDNMVICAGYIS
jgi:hypothetical protein